MGSIIHIAIKMSEKRVGLYLAVHKLNSKGKIYPTTSHESSDGK